MEGRNTYMVVAIYIIWGQNDVDFLQMRQKCKSTGASNRIEGVYTTDNWLKTVFWL
jgi:hypothetical protein